MGLLFKILMVTIFNFRLNECFIGGSDRGVYEGCIPTPFGFKKNMKTNVKIMQKKRKRGDSSVEIYICLLLFVT